MNLKLLRDFFLLTHLFGGEEIGVDAPHPHGEGRANRCEFDFGIRGAIQLRLYSTYTFGDGETMEVRVGTALLGEVLSFSRDSKDVWATVARRGKYRNVTIRKISRS